MHKKRWIYLASTWENRFTLRPIANKIESLGHNVTSNWIWIDESFDGRTEAIRDYNDINGSCTLVLWPDEHTKHSSGKFVEFGIALAWGLDIFIVDRSTSSCVFFDLDLGRMQFVDNWEGLYKLLERK